MEPIGRQLVKKVFIPDKIKNFTYFQGNNAAFGKFLKAKRTLIKNIEEQLVIRFIFTSCMNGWMDG